MADLRWVRLESSALEGAACEVVSLEGEDELNRLFAFSVDLAVSEQAMARALPRELLHCPATLVFEEAGCEVARIHGIASEVRHAQRPDGDPDLVSMTIVPRAWLLTQAHRSEIFLDRTAPEILADRLAAAGLKEGEDFILALRGRYPMRELIAQYKESDFNFFTRLCEDLGIAFFFEHAGGRDVLILADTADAFAPQGRPPVDLRFRARGDDRAAFEIARSLRRAPQQALVHDRNHRAPRHDLVAAAPTGAGVVWGARIEHGAHVKTPGEAEHLARVRAEEMGAAHIVITGKTTEMALRAGMIAALIDESGDAQELLLTRVAHRSHVPGEDPRRGERTWHNEITAIPRGVPYRPPRRTPKPKVPGLVHAIVDGAVKGPYAELDDAGRYKVRFGYDLSGRTDLRASRPVRMLQPHAGARYGMHFPLRPGTEVMIAFVEGDPDRPIIAGAVPDAETPSPVEQANQTQNILRTASRNELVIEDLVGHERIRLHTPRARTTLQLGARDEPEEGALLATDASITAAAARSINQITDRSTLLSATTSALAGGSAVLLAGVEGLLAAIEAPLRRAPGGGLWSDLAAAVVDRARQAAMQTISTLIAAAGAHLDGSLGRLQGDRVGAPGDRSLILGSPETAALFGRDGALISGDRAAVLASQGTASVVGGALAELKSPSRVDVAGGQAAMLTSAGEADVEARHVRIAGGYFPDDASPRFHPMTTVGVISRRELELVSAEDCILVCADKNVLVTAHTGSLELKASQHAALSAGSVSVAGGAIRVVSSADIRVCADGSVEVEAAGDIRVKAAGAVTVEGASVELSGGAIALKGPVKIVGDLSVAGTINGKRL